VAGTHRRGDIGDFGVAWGGIASLQLGLPAVWTEARRRGHNLLDVVGSMAENPAPLVGFTTKGHIALSYAADFVVFAPDEAFMVDKSQWHHKNPFSADHGRPLSGGVRSTRLAGAPINLDDDPRGRLLARGNA
jgi:allantoinase